MRSALETMPCSASVLRAQGEMRDNCCVGREGVNVRMQGSFQHRIASMGTAVSKASQAMLPIARAGQGGRLLPLFQLHLIKHNPHTDRLSGESFTLPGLLYLWLLVDKGIHRLSTITASLIGVGILAGNLAWIAKETIIKGRRCSRSAVQA